MNAIALQKKEYQTHNSSPFKKAPAFFGPSVIQKKLSIGASNDAYEVEADRVADQVVGMSDVHVQKQSQNSLVQRKCSACEEEHVQKKSLAEDITPLIQKKEANSVGGSVASDSVSSRVYSSKGSGHAMDNNTQSYMENRFGTDFSSVQLHTDTNARQLSGELNAQAFTVGNDIYFNEGKYNPVSTSGKHLLAHELTHTLQQMGGLKNKIQMRGPARGSVRRPPVRTPTRNANTNQNSPITVPYHQRYAPPSNFDNSLHALMFRSSVANAQSQIKYRLEIPVATLDRGGTKQKGFISSGSTREYNYIAEGHGGRISYIPHSYHVLDAIEYAIHSANSEAEIIMAIIQNLPDYYGTLLNIGQSLTSRNNLRSMQPIIARIGMPIYPPNFDPGGISRTSVLMTALAIKTRTQPELIRRSRVLSTLIEAEDYALAGVINKRRKEGPCTFLIVPNRGGNRAHDLYASHVAKDRGYGIQNNELKITTPEGISYAFDAYSPNYKNVWEVKTKHEWTSDARMPSSPYIPWFNERIIAMDFQRLRGLYVANRCGVNFKYAFDNCDTVLGMRTQWHNIPAVEYIPFPGEPRVPCMQITEDD